MKSGNGHVSIIYDLRLMIDDWTFHSRFDATVVAQVSKPAVSPISKSAERRNVARVGWADGTQVWKPATQQTWKSALQGLAIKYPILLLIPRCAHRHYPLSVLHYQLPSAQFPLP
jgi:hypothetical protein